MHTKQPGDFPASAGFLFGLGLGGFFDGIVLHQLLQWHHIMSSAGDPPNTLRNLQVNTFFDGVFHASTWVFVVAALAILWHHAKRIHMRWPTRLIAGTVLMGFGIFNLVEGIVDHQLLGLHHVNETVPHEQWILWDMGFLACGAAMHIIGWALKRSAAIPRVDRAIERRRPVSRPLAGGAAAATPPLLPEPARH